MFCGTSTHDLKRITQHTRITLCGGSAATRLYNPLGGAYFTFYGCVLLSRSIGRRRLSGVQLIVDGVNNYERLDCISAYYVLVTRLSACTVECTAINGRL